MPTKVAILCAVLLAGVRPVAGREFQDATSPPPLATQPKVRYIEREWAFDDVDVKNLVMQMRSIGVSLPVSLRGRISGTLKVGLPWGAMRDARAWKFGGTLTSKSLQIDDRLIEQFNGHLDYRDGVLSLTKLSFQVPDKAAGPATPAGQAGMLNGTARMELMPSGQFTAKLNVVQLPLAAVIKPTKIVKQIGGRVTGSLSASVPVADIQNRAAWQVTGPVKAEDLVVGDIPAIDGQLLFEFLDDTVNVKQLKATSGPIQLGGGAELKLFERGEWLVNANLDTQDLAAAQARVAQLLPDNIRKLIRERLFGKVRVTAKVTGTLLPFSLTATGTLAGTDVRLRIDDLASTPPEFVRFDQIESDYKLTEASLELSRLKADGPDLTAEGTGALKFDDNFTCTFDGKATTDRADKTARTFRRFLPQRWDTDAARPVGMVGITGRFVGALKPFSLTVDGTVGAANVTIDGYPISRLESEFVAERTSITFKNAMMKALGGQFFGEIKLPLDPQTNGLFSATFDGIEVDQVAGRFGIPLKAAGQIAGRIDATVPAGGLADPGAWSLVLTAKLPTAQLYGRSIGNFHATAKQANRRLEYQATGSMLSGELKIQGHRQTPPMINTADKAGEQVADNNPIGKARLTLTKASIQQALEAYQSERIDQPIRGDISVEADLQETPAELTWDGTVQLSRTSIGRIALSDGVRGRISGDQSTFRLDDVQGSLAGGRLTASVAWAKTGRLAFDVSLKDARLERLRLLDPATSRLPVSGLVEFDLKGESGRVWSMRGTASTNQGELGHVRFHRIRIPLSASWSPSSRRLRVESPAFRASVARGRVNGEFRIDFSPQLEIRGDCEFHQLDLARLARQFDQTSHFARGKVTGRLTVSGRNIRSLRDIDATFNADLQNSQAFGLPILNGLPALIPGASAATSFRYGRLEARMKQGVIDVTRLSLARRDMAIYISGKVNSTGRLRLHAIVATGTNQNLALAQIIVSRVAAATPAGWLLLANDYLSNRTLHIEIQGTAKRPIMRLKPFESLQEEAVRFLMRRVVGAPLPTPVNR